MIEQAFDSSALADLAADALALLLKGISKDSTRVGLNQDMFAGGEDLAWIMSTLSWKSPRLPLAYNRNLAAEQGVLGDLWRRLGDNKLSTNVRAAIDADQCYQIVLNRSSSGSEG